MLPQAAPPTRTREGSRPRDTRPGIGTYLQVMPPRSRDARRAAFAQFMERALNRARERGMTIPQIERATGVKKSTFYRWRSGEWTRDPNASDVKAFAEGLDIPLVAAYQPLGWTIDDTPEVTPPEPVPADVATILRRLRDPNVPEAEKYHIMATLRALAERAPAARRTS